MNWGSIDAFLAMGGYGLYVWGSYAVTFMLLLGEVVMLGMRRRAILKALRRAAARRSAP